MCIAILNISNKLSKETLKNAWDNNEQGAGLLWNESGKLQTFKTYKFNKLLKKYNQLRESNTIGKIVLHFRIATSGYQKYTNLHPFLVSENIGFVHNGVISGLGDKTYSDTYYFNELLKSLPANFINCNSTLELIAGYIGNSKLVFLDSSDNHKIVNENLGHWNEGNWYSNDSYTCDLDYYYYGNEKYYKAESRKYDNFDDLFDYYDSYKSPNLLPTLEEENLRYFEDYWINSDTFTIEKVLKLTGESLNNPELWMKFEGLNGEYCTNNLIELIRYIESDCLIN